LQKFSFGFVFLDCVLTCREVCIAEFLRLC
jgi:hypothetical protein